MKNEKVNTVPGFPGSGYLRLRFGGNPLHNKLTNCIPFITFINSINSINLISTSHFINLSTC
jgi:hypothetical protein